MSRLKKFSFLFSLIVLLGCTNPLPTLTSFEKEKWEEDKHGCFGDRELILPNLISQKEKLLTLTEGQIMKLLGKPDKIQLYQRNQKFFMYSINSIECDESDRSLRELIIRFSAMGRSQEITIESILNP